MTTLNLPQLEIVQGLQRRLAEVPHGERGAVMQRGAQFAGISLQTLYRWMAAAGLESGRKRRTDAGTTAMTEPELLDVSTALLETYRKSGQRIMTLENALEILVSNGRIQTALSASRVATLLRDRGLHPEQLTRPTPAIEQRSLHPNHVWQVDASVCVAYYLSNAQGLCVMDEKKFYKNKPDNLTRVQKERLIRYVVADHCTHEILVRYYTGSECSDSLTDFLIWAFAPKHGAHVMEGVPFILQMDMGSANTSAVTLNLLARLQVRVIVHQRHNSRANGSVEKAHHIVELGFESSLRLKRIADLADLNHKAVVWANHMGATKVHSRLKTPRHDAYLRITADQKRIAPPVPVMQGFVHTRPKPCRVSNNLQIRLKVPGHGPQFYDVDHVPGVMAGAKLRTVVSPYRMPSIDVEFIDAETGEATWMTVEPVQYGADGRREDAPIIGVQQRTAPRGLLEHHRDRVLQNAYGGTVEEAEARKEKGELVFGGEVDPFKPAAEADLPSVMPKRGTPLQVERRALVAPVLPIVEVCKRIRAELGEAYDPKTYGWLIQRFPDGMPEDQLHSVIAQLQPQPANTLAATGTTDAAPHGLRVVTG